MRRLLVLAVMLCGIASAATVTFVTSDSTTQGTWRGTSYGTDGYNIIQNTVNYPSYATVSVSGNSAFTWNGSTADVRALQKPSPATDRIAATWFTATNESIDLNLTDGNTHRVALYFLDWDSGGARTQRIDISDQATSTILDTRNISSYNNGLWLVWDINGHVVVTITNTNGSSNAVISGLFFQPPGGGPTHPHQLPTLGVGE